MRPVIPPDDLPNNVQAVQFNPPEGMEEQVNKVAGLVHYDNDGNKAAMEFMFELSQEELQVLNHEPYLTLTVMADHLHPFALQSSFPPEPDRYDKLDSHNHKCVSNLTHETEQFWRCFNPRHANIKGKELECDSCWQVRLFESDKKEEQEQTGD